MEAARKVDDKFSKGEKASDILFDLFDSYVSIFLPRLGMKCPRSDEFRAFFR